MIAEKGIAGVQFLFPMLQGCAEIGADGEDLGIILIKICDTRLVRGEFLGSTTGEGGHKEGQDDDLLAAEVREFNLMVIGIGQGEVGRHVADFQRGFRRRELLRRKHGSKGGASQECTDGSHDSSQRGSNFFETG